MTKRCQNTDRTIRASPPATEAQELFASDPGRRHSPVRSRRRLALPVPAADHPADRRRPPGSDDQKLIQTLAQTFARDRSPVRLTPITTEGAAESIALLAAGKADLAVARGDLNLPANAESVVILRKNVVVLWAPSGLPAKGLEEAAGAEDQIDRRTRRPSRRRHRPDASQCHAAPRDPHRVRRQSRQGRGDAIRHQPDRRDGARPDARCLHDGRPARQQDHHATRSPRPRRAAASRNSCRSMFRKRSRRSIRSTNPRKFPPASSLPRRRGPRTRSTPSASIT